MPDINVNGSTLRYLNEGPRDAPAIVCSPSMFFDLSINTPVLVVAGTEDHIYPRSKSVQIAELIPGAELQMMERTGHVLAIENPTAVNELLEEHLGGL